MNIFSDYYDNFRGWENKDGKCVFYLLAPGLKSNEIEITGDDETLTFVSNKKDVIFTNINYTLIIPETIDKDTIKITLTDGIITITADRVDASKTRRQYIFE